MRQLIIQSILDLKESENGFSKETMRWKIFYFQAGRTSYHISEISSSFILLMSDEELLDLYKRLTIRSNKQM